MFEIFGAFFITLIDNLFRKKTPLKKIIIPNSLFDTISSTILIIIALSMITTNINTLIITYYTYHLARIAFSKNNKIRLERWNKFSTIEPAFYFAIYPLSKFLGVMQYISIIIFSIVAYIQMDFMPFKTQNKKPENILELLHKNSYKFALSYFIASQINRTIISAIVVYAIFKIIEKRLSNKININLRLVRVTTAIQAILTFKIFN